MIRHIRNTIMSIKEVAGIDIHFLPDEKMLLFGAHLKISGGKVVTIANIDRVETIRALKENIRPGVPVSLSVNGYGVMMRKIPLGDHSNLISGLLPGANPNEFYHNIHRINEQEAIAFIIRKTKADEIISSFSEIGLRVLSLSVGTKGVENILPFIDNGKVTLLLQSLTIEIISQNVVSVQPADAMEPQVFKEIRIGETIYRKTASIGVGNALKLLHRHAAKISSDVLQSGISYLQRDYVFYKQFRFAKWFLLAATLTLLVINFFAFNYYYHKNERIKEQNSLSLAQQQQQVHDGSRLDSIYSFFITAGWNKYTRHSYFIDRMAALVPATVTFNSLDVAPLQESRGTNDYVFAYSNIIVSGVSDDPSDLETFSRSLKNIEGVERVAISRYSYKQDISAAIFTIEITIKN